MPTTLSQAFNPFNQLKGAVWRDLGFPWVTIETSGGQTLVAHQRVDRSGARQEGTGRTPYSFKVHAPFMLLQPGPNETWPRENLFPGHFYKFLAALEDRSSAIFQHPLLGPIRCVPGTWTIPLDAAVRGGVFLDFELNETTEVGDAPSLGAQEFFSMAKQAALDLDAAIAQINPKPPIPSAYDDDQSIGEFVDSIGAVGDQLSLAQQQAFGKIDNMISKIDGLADSISSTATLIETTPAEVGKKPKQLGNSVAHVAIASARLISALHGIKAQAQKQSDTLGFYTVQKATTLSALSVDLRCSISDLSKLNPELLGRPIIPRFSVVRFYRQPGAVSLNLATLSTPKL